MESHFQEWRCRQGPWQGWERAKLGCEHQRRRVGREKWVQKKGEEERRGKDLRPAGPPYNPNPQLAIVTPQWLLKGHTNQTH